MRPDRGALEAARHGVARSPHWPAVERAFRETFPHCLACPAGRSDGPIQVHHVAPFHVVIALGRPDLELDTRNLVSLCEAEKDKPASDHHLLVGHLDDFKSANLRVREDATGPYLGMAADAIRADAAWQAEEREGRLKALDLMTADEKRALRTRLDAELPPDPELCARYGIEIKPYESAD